MSVKIKQEQSSRRAFMKTSLKASTASVTASALGLGFVAASEPVMAQATLRGSRQESKILLSAVLICPPISLGLKKPLVHYRL